MLRAVLDGGDRARRSLRATALVGLSVLSLGLGTAGVVALNDDDRSPAAGGSVLAQETTPDGRTKDCPERDGGEATLLAFAAQDATAAAGQAQQPLPSGDLSVADVAERANPAVVTITNLQNGFGADEALPFGAGSGFIIDAEGHVVTNNHVVDDADELTVQFFDGTTVPATVVGRDELQDVAVLQLDLSGGEEVPGILAFGDSETVRAGDQVVSIGSSLGEFTNTVTDGTVGAVDRSLGGLPNLIQHDVPIWRGNSGGPLLNLRGEVIGVNVAGIGGERDRGDFQDALPAQIAFAIESNAVREVAEELIANGVVERPYLGISGEATEEGQLVLEVVAGGPADEAGIEEGDVITAINGQAIDGRDNSLLDLLLELEPGETATLTVDRDGAEQEVEVVLGLRPEETQ